MYEKETKAACKTNSSIHCMVPLKVTNINREILDETHDEPTLKANPSRLA